MRPIADMRAVADDWRHGYFVDRHCDPRGASRPLRRRVCRTAIGPRHFRIEVLGIVEIDADERIVALVAFDLDDIDAAFEELDARYLAGEAAAHAHTWSVIAGLTPRSTGANFPNDAGLGHRRPPAAAHTVEASDQQHLRASGISRRTSASTCESVHRLSDFGAVVTYRRMGPRQKASTGSGE